MLLKGFTPTGTGFTTELDEEAATLLGVLLSETITVLDAPDVASYLSALLAEDRRDEPEDPALRVLLPSMSSDPEEAGTLRALTEDSLRAKKSGRLEEIQRALAHIVAGKTRTITISSEHVWSWLSGLNDLRLVLADRLGVAQSEDSEYWYLRVLSIFEDDEAEPQELSSDDLIGLVYSLVSWWQDSLLQAVQGEEPPSNL